MKKIEYFIIPKLVKFGVPAIILFYIVKYYETIEFYKYFIIAVPIFGFIILRKINLRYIKWDDKIIKLKTPGNKTEVVINTENISRVKIKENEGVTLELIDSSSYFIPFEGLGRNYNIDVEILKRDFKKIFSHLI